MKDIKCINCGKSKHLVDYENGYYECELCDIKFYIKIIERKDYNKDNTGSKK